MHPADIKAALAKAGWSQARLAREMKRPPHRAAVSRVIAGTLKAERIARAIARATGMRVSELWPGKYPELEALEHLDHPVPPARGANR